MRFMRGERNNFEWKQKRCYIYITTTIDSSGTVEGITVVRIKTIKLKNRNFPDPLSSSSCSLTPIAVAPRGLAVCWPNIL